MAAHERHGGQRLTVRYAACGKVDLAYETFGSSGDPALVLVMGLGTQMIAWHNDFCNQVADEGFQVVRFDNRDVGLSTHLNDAGEPDLSSMFAGGQITQAPYALSEMADDTVRLFDALSLDRVHLVGASMGGMIAQEVALRHPERLLSLTSIFSTTSPQVGSPTPEALAALFTPPATTEEEAGDRTVAVYRVIGSPHYPLDEAGLRARGREAFRRSNDPAGVARQFAAVQVSGDRTERLRSVAVPTLVLHGEDDSLVQPDGGRATATAIPGARLVTYPGMGHDLPRALWPQVVGEIVKHSRSASHA